MESFRIVPVAPDTCASIFAVSFDLRLSESKPFCIKTFPCSFAFFAVLAFGVICRLRKRLKICALLPLDIVQTRIIQTTILVVTFRIARPQYNASLFFDCPAYIGADGSPCWRFIKPLQLDLADRAALLVPYHIELSCESAILPAPAAAIAQPQNIVFSHELRNRHLA